MIHIERFQVNMISENCYVVNDDTKECVIIDCGAYYEEERQAIVDYIRQNDLKPKHLLATHGHVDHNFGNDTIYHEFQLRPEYNDRDEELMKDLKGQAKMLFNLDIDNEYPAAANYLEDGDSVKFGNHEFSVITTPGHSPGGVCYYCKEENILFSGDTLFCGSIGRTDFIGGNQFLIIQSLRQLGQLPDETRIFPGHGQQTTMGNELATNPYMDR